MEIKELDKAFVEAIESNIIVITIKIGFTIEVEDIKKIKAYNLDLMGKKEYGIIVDAKNYTSVSSGARKLMASESIEKNRKATSIVFYEFWQCVLGNIYIWFNRPSVPTRLFSNKKDAINWMKETLNDRDPQFTPNN